MENTFTPKNSYKIFPLLLFSILAGYSLNAQVYMGAWNPVTYPEQVGTPGWEVQDDAASGTITDPFASWSKIVDIIESGSTNQTVTLLPDAFIEAFDYDNADGDNNVNTGFESTLGHNLATELNITSAQNGLSIDGTLGGCFTVLDNTSNGSGSLFGTIVGADDITIKGMYLLNGYAGAFIIENSTNIVFEDCVFDNNDLNSVPVFRILSQGSAATSVTFTRCKFINNNHGSGGIVHSIKRESSGGTLDVTFTDCVWSCNSSGSGGTAMKIENEASADGPTITVTGSTFANNTTTGSQGGAIWFDGANSTSTFTNTNFIENKVLNGGNGGGAVFIGNDENITFDGCTFYKNESTSSSADGGAINATSGSSGSAPTLTILNSTFDGNQSGDDGGAIQMRYAQTTITNVHLINNSAGDGVVTLGNSGACLNLTNYSCSGNSAPDGCIYNRGGSSCFTDNGGSATGTAVDLSSTASNFNCGAYCALEIPGTCLAVSRGNGICAASGSIDISGQAWNDIDGDGIQESGDNGIENVFILLYDANGYLIGRTNTDANGDYAFNGLPAGTYNIVFVNPNTATYPHISPANNSGATESTDSDIIDEITMSSAPISSTTTNVDGGFTDMLNPLPVELISFNGMERNGNVLLHWTTAFEMNNNGFEIEKSEDGITWGTIGFVGGNNNTNTVSEYEFIDFRPLSGLNYYRLKQLDLNGQFEYSNIITIRITGPNFPFTFFPSPVNKDLNLIINSNLAEQGTVNIFEFSGKKLISLSPNFEKGENKITLNLSSLEAGIYFIQVTIGNEILHPEKFIKN